MHLSYRKQLLLLQIELVKLQRHFIMGDHKIVVILEGRDAAGKDGMIKRIAEHLSPRETRIVALGKPSDREKSSWYFQRFVNHLPSARELVLFNRSWYNRAGVERVMGFCSAAEYEEYFSSVIEFEHMLIRSGISLFKYYLDISRDEQARRLESRKQDPLKQWKISPIDDQALHYFDEYSVARDIMLARTHNEISPWTVVDADNKRDARLHMISNLLSRLNYADKDESVLLSGNDVVWCYSSQNKQKTKR